MNPVQVILLHNHHRQACRRRRRRRWIIIIIMNNVLIMKYWVKLLNNRKIIDMLKIHAFVVRLWLGSPSITTQTLETMIKMWNVIILFLFLSSWRRLHIWNSGQMCNPYIASRSLFSFMPAAERLMVSGRWVRSSSHIALGEIWSIGKYVLAYRSVPRWWRLSSTPSPTPPPWDIFARCTIY